VNELEAKQVQEIFTHYLRLQSVNKLLPCLHAKGITHKQTRNGLRVADKPFTENTLYAILKHPVYLGKIHHQGELHDGQHDAIIDPAIWEAAGKLIASQARSKEGRYNPSGLLLQGKLYDADGSKYRCHFSESPKLKKRHHYYVSQEQNRLPAALIEKTIITALQHPEVLTHLSLNEERQQQWLKLLAHQPAQILQPQLQKIIIGKEATWINLSTENLDTLLKSAKDLPAVIASPDPETLLPLTITTKLDHLEIRLPQSFAEKNAIYANRASKHNEGLRTALGQGFKWQRMLQDDTTLDQRALAKQEGVDYRYLTRALHMMMLAPDVMTAILDGTQPSHLSMNTFRTINLPICWKAQRKLLGFAS